jgi:hypothetical protein
MGGVGVAAYGRGMRSPDSSAFMPLELDDHSVAWNASNVSLNHGPPGSPTHYTVTIWIPARAERA